MTEDLFRVVVTAIVKNKDGKVLITKRTPTKKRWPNKWTVPGGQVAKEDFLGKPTEINNQWYGVLENAVRREVREETGFEIDNIKFLCDIAIPDCIIISFTAELFPAQEYNYPGSNLADIPYLQQDECDDWAWVTYEEAKEYDLIDGLLEEIKWATK